MAEQPDPLKEWHKSVRAAWKEKHGRDPDPVNPGAPGHTVLERMMRVGVEARFFNVDADEYDRLVLLAWTTLLKEQL